MANHQPNLAVLLHTKAAGAALSTGRNALRNCTKPTALQSRTCRSIPAFARVPPRKSRARAYDTYLRSYGRPASLPPNLFFFQISHAW